jgi:hypothetical protein
MVNRISGELIETGTAEPIEAYIARYEKRLASGYKAVAADRDTASRARRKRVISLCTCAALDRATRGR